MIREVIFKIDSVENGQVHITCIAMVNNIVIYSQKKILLAEDTYNITLNDGDDSTSILDGKNEVN
jgi:hypothetical protein